jgi:hypothetical protein
MSTELVDGEGLLCSIYWWLQNWLRTKYLLPVNQFCSHQYIEQSNPSPSTSSVVINMSNKVPPPRQPVLLSSIRRTKYPLPVNKLCSPGRGYFVRHIDDYRTGWRGGDTLFDILMTTELVDGEGVLFCRHQYVEQSTPSTSTSSIVINMSNKVPPLRQPVL